MERIAHILAAQLCEAELAALSQAAAGCFTLPVAMTEDLRRLRLIDPMHAGLTPLGRDVWRLVSRTRKA